MDGLKVDNGQMVDAGVDCSHCDSLLFDSSLCCTSTVLAVVVVCLVDVLPPLLLDVGCLFHAGARCGCVRCGCVIDQPLLPDGGCFLHSGAGCGLTFVDVWLINHGVTAVVVCLLISSSEEGRFTLWLRLIKHTLQRGSVGLWVLINLSPGIPMQISL